VIAADDCALKFCPRSIFRGRGLKGKAACTQLKDASVFQGDGRNNLISDTSGDDVIHGAQADDLIRISDGNDTILYGKGDGYDVITDWANSENEHDTSILTDINSDDVEPSRVGGDLILTAEYVDFTNFYPVGTGDWSTAPIAL
jgi:hypothetical protein